MITSKHIIDLSEKYYKAQQVNYYFVEIYENPTPSDLKTLRESAKPRDLLDVRYIASATSQAFYIWDAFFATHENMCRLCDVSQGALDKSPSILHGECEVTGNKLDPHPYQIKNVFSLVNYAINDFYSDKGNFLSKFFGNKWDFAGKHLGSGFTYEFNRLKDLYIKKQSVKK